jgi:opacity protein-like surface antigen
VLISLLTFAALSAHQARAQTLFEDERWELRLDMGGTIPQDANLTRFGDPVSGQSLKLSPGFQMDFAFNYKLTPWLAIGPELGFLYNSVSSFGDISYHDSFLFQMPMMANLTLEYPTQGRLRPYIGGGVGGVVSSLTFGEDYYWGPDGIGSDFTFGFQVFAGVNYRLSQSTYLGVMYRFLYTDSQDWNVEWWTDWHFHVAVDPIQVHSFCLVLSCRF